jgi:hypothetical protein
MNAIEINGKPAVWVQVRVAEKINIGNFSNVDLELTYGRWVEDLGTDGVKSQFDEAFEVTEDHLANEREKVLKSIGKS